MKTLFLIALVFMSIFKSQVNQKDKSPNDSLESLDKISVKIYRYERFVSVGHRGFKEKLILRKKKFKLKRSFPYDNSSITIKGDLEIKNDLLILKSRIFKVKGNENYSKKKYFCKDLDNLNDFKINCRIDTFSIQNGNLIEIENGELYDNFPFIKK